MSLGLGGGTLPPNFGMPNPVWFMGAYRTNGVIWVGKEEIQESDILALENSGYPAKIDPMTMVGRLNRRWTTLANVLRPELTKSGGEGSHVYEHQLVGPGVQFTELPIWYHDEDGNMQYDVPPQGAYHKVDVGGGYQDIMQGPEPGSPADEYRGDGEFYFDEEHAWYDAR